MPSFPDAAGVSNMTALAAVLKEYYGAQQLKTLVYKRNKWWAMIKKETDWSGSIVPIPLIYGNPQGGSADFATAQANVTASQTVRFVMNWIQDYAVARITNLVQLATRNDAGAFLKAARQELDGALKTAENSLAGGLFRAATGTLGTSTGIASGVITLTNVSDVTQFERGQTLEASATDGGALLGAAAYVVGVDRAGGKVSVAVTQGGAVATPASWTGVMYIRRAGDRNLKINGLIDFLPTAAPTPGDSFNGVDRSPDPTRLGGVRYDGSAQTIEEACIDAAALVAREDGSPEIGITNHASWAALVKTLGSKVQYVNFESDETPGIGFQGVRINGPDGEINIFADRSCQSKRMFLIDPETWVLGSMLECPHILTELDGLEKLRGATTDTTEIRIGSYVMNTTNAPGRNANVSLQS